MSDNSEKPVHPLERRVEQPIAPKQPPQQPEGPRIIGIEGLSKPVVTYVLLGINIVVFLIDRLLGGQLTVLGWKEDAAIIAGEFWRLFTPMFLHGGLIHLGLNSYFLYIVGPQIERTFGAFRFLILYILAGIAGAVASFALTPNPSIGASGALFGLLGAFVPFLLLNRELLPNTDQSLRQIGLIIGINLLFGLQPGIDNWGHIGGMLGGMAMAWFITPLYKAEPAAYFSEDLKLVDQSDPVTTTLAAGAALTVLLGLLTALLIGVKV
ncbi:MAG: rhomboid family intramembrane serine protease [Anaerolineae bacterium]